jgi:HK97 gp10 family phage protein
MSEPFAHIKGLEGLQAALSRLPGKIQEKLAVRAASAAAKVVQDYIKARAPRRQEGGVKGGTGKSKARNPGNLARHISRRRIKKGSGASVTYSVYPSKSAFYGRYVEQGHGPPNSRKRKREATYLAEFGGRSTPAHPFMRPAADSAKAASVEKFAQVLRDGLAEAVEDSK